MIHAKPGSAVSALASARANLSGGAASAAYAPSGAAAALLNSRQHTIEASRAATATAIETVQRVQVRRAGAVGALDELAEANRQRATKELTQEIRRANRPSQSKGGGGEGGFLFRVGKSPAGGVDAYLEGLARISPRLLAVAGAAKVASVAVGVTRFGPRARC